MLSNAVRTLVGPSGGAQGVKSPQRIVLQVDGADADRFMIEVKKTLETDPWTELEAYS